MTGQANSLIGISSVAANIPLVPRPATPFSLPESPVPFAYAPLTRDSLAAPLRITQLASTGTPRHGRTSVDRLIAAHRWPAGDPPSGYCFPADLAISARAMLSVRTRRQPHAYGRTPVNGAASPAW